MRFRVFVPIIAVVVLVGSLLYGLSILYVPLPIPDHSNDVVVSLERTACYGPCPVYSVVVFEDGTVIFEGKEFVENIGIFEYQIPTTDVEKIFDKFYEINYFALDDRYEIGATDHPTVITSFMNERYEKTVSNYGDAGPSRLHDLEVLIDKLANTQTMITKTIPSQTKKIASTFEMKPNTMEFFYYPDPETTKDRDPFQKFILIRLPKSLGGDAHDVSSFRAYSAVSLTDHCLVKYWPEEGRQRMENPCRGGIYRAIDGLLISGVDPVKIISPMALPHLDLSMNRDGTLYVEPPMWIPEKNGVVGIGRHMSMQDIRHGSQAIAESFAISNPGYPRIPVDFAGLTLAEIESRSNRAEARYVDLSSMSEYLTIHMQRLTAQETDYSVNLAKANSEFWQIGQTVISLEKDGIQFLKDGFKIRIEGKNTEFVKKEIVTNYFPEYNYDEMFLISKTPLR